MKSRNNPYQKVYEQVRKVPAGKVTTYGLLGKKLNMSPRVIGYALHANPDGEKTPCHRVVNRDGCVAPGYAFGGPGIQRKRLEKEGVKFKDEKNIDLQEYLWVDF